MYRVCLVAMLLSAALFARPAVAEPKIELQQDSEGVTVNVDGELFTRYIIKSGAKPILFPVVGPSGKEMTRGYPMRDAEGDEKKDHVHQRSFWFTHGDVNGIDFWAETPGHGVVEHRKFGKVAAEGNTAVVETTNDWVGPDGVKHCTDERRFTFGADDNTRWIDVDITVKAADRPVKFGDTKEGSFGLRVEGSMRVELKKGGRIVNSEGQTDVEAWGKPAAWVDYSGPVEGETLGVAIMNHPSSFRFPTHWHVRTYGLFAANPFGLRDFKGSKEIDGSHTLQPGESFSLRYRVLFHTGDADAANLPAAFKAYAS